MRILSCPLVGTPACSPEELKSSETSAFRACGMQKADIAVSRIGFECKVC